MVRVGLLSTASWSSAQTLLSACIIVNASFAWMTGISTFGFCNSRPYLLLHSKTSNPIRMSNDNEGEDFKIKTIDDLRKAINELSNVVRHESDAVGRSTQSIDDPSLGYDLADLEDYFNRRQQQIDTNSSFVFNKSDGPQLKMRSPGLEDSVMLSDGLFLDPELYVKSRMMTNEDGSINFGNDNTSSPRAFRDQKGVREQLLEKIVQPAPLSPDSNVVRKDRLSNIEDIEDPLMKENEQVWETLRKFQSEQRKLQNLSPEQLKKVLSKSGSSSSRAEQLHAEVFENEGTFWNNSKVFRESLINQTKVAEAKALRRMDTKFHQRQRAAREKLEAGLQEMEESLFSQRKTQQQRSTSDAGEDVDMETNDRTENKEYPRAVNTSADGETPRPPSLPDPKPKQHLESPKKQAKQSRARIAPALIQRRDADQKFRRQQRPPQPNIREDTEK